MDITSQTSGGKKSRIRYTTSVIKCCDGSFTGPKHPNCPKPDLLSRSRPIIHMYKVKTDNFNIPMLYFNMLYLLNIDIYFSQPILTQNLRAKSLEHSESAISGSGLFKISGDVFLFARLCWKTRRNTDASIS